MKFISNFFLLGLLFTLLMLPLTVIDVATFNSHNAEVLSTHTYMPNVLPTSGVAPVQPNYENYYVDDTSQSSSAIDVSKFDYYQMPSLYLGVPEGVE